MISKRLPHTNRNTLALFESVALKCSDFVLLFRTVSVTLVVSVLVIGAAGQANVQGQWSTLGQTMPINPIHAALLRTGNILVVTGSGNCPPSQAGCPSGPPYELSNLGSGAILLDPTTGISSALPAIAWDMFCTGMMDLPDGRILIAGGTLQTAPNGGYSPFYGSPKASIFDPSNNTFTDQASMAHGRWYPTLTSLNDGTIMVFSGFNENGEITNDAVEIFTAGSGWSPQYIADWTPPLYPRLHLLPNGTIFYSGETPTTRSFNPSNQSWTTVANTVYGITRTYGSSVLLALTPANNYDPKVIIMGGGNANPATATSEIIDLGASSPAWKAGPNMSEPRIEMNATLLPNGKVLALGGSTDDEDSTTASYNADLYDPASNAFSSAGQNAYPRLYHSVSLLLPDATVWFAGGNPERGSYENHMEIYKPAYLFNSDGTLASRPTISSAPSTISYGTPFTVQTPSAASISSVVLMRDGAVTHAFDMNQRMVGMSFSAGSGSLTVTAPPNANIAPPGYYMLFLLNSSGVPSTASFVQITNSTTPYFMLGASPSTATVRPGTPGTYTISATGMNGFGSAVQLACNGGLPSGASCSFNPASITPASGPATATLTINTVSGTSTNTYEVAVTGTSGSLSSNTSVTLVVSTPTIDFSLNAVSPVTVSAGASTTSTVSVSATNGFNSAVTLTCAVSGSGTPELNTAPSCSTPSPSSIMPSQTSTVAVQTTSSTPPGSYTFTVTGTSGSLTHQSTVTVTVTQAASFSLSAPNPASATVDSGSSTTFTSTVTGTNGFTGNVSFACSIATSATPAPKCTASPSSVTLSSSSSTASVTVSVTTAAQQALLLRAQRGICYAFLFPFMGLSVVGFNCQSTSRNRGIALLLALLLTVGLIFLAACGGGSSSPSPTSRSATGGTPAGSYIVTVTATSGSSSPQPITFTLNVQ